MRNTNNNSNDNGVIDLVRDRAGRFVPGHSPLPGNGRPRGARARLGEKFFQDLFVIWREEGPEAARRTARERPEHFLRSMAIIFRPYMTELNQEQDQTAPMSEAEIRAVMLDALPSLLPDFELVPKRAKLKKPA